MAFPTTRWSLLRAVDDPAQARAAWSELATIYRPAIVAFCAGRFGREQAEDLTQQFFAESIAASWWSRADAELGSFRTYLRVLLVRFGERHGPRFAVSAAGDDAFEPAIPDSERDPRNLPEHAYEAAFAAVVIARARAALDDRGGDDPVQRALLSQLLDGSDHGDLKRLAERLGMAENTLAQRLRRLRQAFRDRIRQELADLVADPDRVDDELAALAGVLRQ